MSIEQSICESHSKEKLYDETLAVTRIKSDPNFFFRYAKKFIHSAELPIARSTW